jgi:hypothetical protein
MKEHVTRQVQSGNYALSRILKIRHLLTQPVAKMAVNSLALSKLTFGGQCVVAAGQLARLQKVQNFAARIVCQSSVLEHTRPIIKQLGWLPISDSLNVRSLALLHRTVHQSVNTSKGFRFVDVHVCASQARDTRPKTIILYDQYWSDMDLRKRTAKLWNDLPRNIREIEGPRTFKRAIIKFYTDIS